MLKSVPNTKALLSLDSLMEPYFALAEELDIPVGLADWLFPSTRLNGKQPRVANMLVEDHPGQPLSRQVFFHRTRTIRADLWMTIRDDSVFIIFAKPRVMSHPNQNRSKDRANFASPATLSRRFQFYTHAVSRDRMVAAGKMLSAILSHAARQERTG